MQKLCHFELRRRRAESKKVRQPTQENSKNILTNTNTKKTQNKILFGNNAKVINHNGIVTEYYDSFTDNNVIVNNNNANVIDNNTNVNQPNAIVNDNNPKVSIILR